MLTVRLPVAPTKIDWLAGASASVGESSLRMVPVPRPTAMFALTGLERSTKNVSLGSTSVSPFTSTVMVCEPALPAGNVSVPVVATKSEPAVAVPLAVA